MDKMPTNHISESSSSDTNDDDILKLSLMMEQLKLTDQIGPRPRRFFCDDVLLDALHFLRRKEHAPVRLACRRLQWLSNAVYPPSMVSRFEVRGVRALPAANGVPLANAASPRFNANSMRVFLVSGDSYLADFPAVEPPEDIVQLPELKIRDFVGLELLEFLRVSARLMDGCLLGFTDFDNFVRHHSTDFIVRFLALFRSTNRIFLNRLSSLAVPLFIDHSTMFNCTDLSVACLDTFPLDALQNWLHLDEQQPLEQQKVRFLFIRFEDEDKMDQRLASVDHFVQLLRQRFLSATSCCSFTVCLLFGGPDIPELDPFVEDNGRTGELLEFRRDGPHCYDVRRRRRRRESTAAAGRGEGDGGGGGEATTTQMDKETKVYIWRVVQGDKQ